MNIGLYIHESPRRSTKGSDHFAVYPYLRKLVEAGHKVIWRFPVAKDLKLDAVLGEWKLWKDELVELGMTFNDSDICEEEDVAFFCSCWVDPRDSNQVYKVLEKRIDKGLKVVCWDADAYILHGAKDQFTDFIKGHADHPNFTLLISGKHDLPEYERMFDVTTCIDPDLYQPIQPKSSRYLLASYAGGRYRGKDVRTPLVGSLLAGRTRLYGRWKSFKVKEFEGLYVADDLSDIPEHIAYPRLELPGTIPCNRRELLDLYGNSLYSIHPHYSENEFPILTHRFQQVADAGSLMVCSCDEHFASVFDSRLLYRNSDDVFAIAKWLLTLTDEEYEVMVIDFRKRMESIRHIDLYMGSVEEAFGL